jgi:hypothetical protein
VPIIAHEGTVIDTTGRGLTRPALAMKASSDFPLPPTLQAAYNSAMEEPMRERTLTIPEIFMIAGTRVALGAGLGLLLAERLGRDTRRGAGCALLAVGVLSTIPIALGILAKPHHPSQAPESA